MKKNAYVLDIIIFCFSELHFVIPHYILKDIAQLSFLASRSPVVFEQYKWSKRKKNRCPEHILLTELLAEKDLIYWFFLMCVNSPRDNRWKMILLFKKITRKTKLNKTWYLECFLVYLNGFIHSWIILKVLINEVPALKRYNVQILNKLNNSENFFCGMTTF